MIENSNLIEVKKIISMVRNVTVDNLNNIEKYEVTCNDSGGTVHEVIFKTNNGLPSYALIAFEFDGRLSTSNTLEAFNCDCKFEFKKDDGEYYIIILSPSKGVVDTPFICYENLR